MSAMKADLDLNVIHPSLTKPVLWGGVERRIVGMEFVIVIVLFTWKGITPATFVLLACVLVPIHLIARRITRQDPRMVDLFLRSLTWLRYYPPHASIHAASPPVKRSIPGAK